MWKIRSYVEEILWPNLVRSFCSPAWFLDACVVTKMNISEHMLSNVKGGIGFLDLNMTVCTC